MTGITIYDITEAMETPVVHPLTVYRDTLVKFRNGEVSYGVLQMYEDSAVYYGYSVKDIDAIRNTYRA
jgi:hypothetical protein